MGRGQQCGDFGAARREAHFPLHFLNTADGLREIMQAVKLAPVSLILPAPLADNEGLLHDKVYLEYQAGATYDGAPPFHGLFDEGIGLPASALLTHRLIERGVPIALTAPGGALVFSSSEPVPGVLPEDEENSNGLLPGQDRLMSKIQVEIPPHYRHLLEVLGDLDPEQERILAQTLLDVFQKGFHEGETEMTAQMIERGYDINVSYEG